jgi:hypothetical protein
MAARVGDDLHLLEPSAIGEGERFVEDDHLSRAWARFEHHQAKARQLLIDLDSVDATIRMFAPDIDLTEVKPKPMPPRHAAYKGEVARIARDTSRCKAPLLHPGTHDARHGRARHEYGG